MDKSAPNNIFQGLPDSIPGDCPEACPISLLSRTFMHANVHELLLHTSRATLTLILINSDILLGHFPLPV